MTRIFFKFLLFKRIWKYSNFLIMLKALQQHGIRTNYNSNVIPVAQESLFQFRNHLCTLLLSPDASSNWVTPAYVRQIARVIWTESYAHCKPCVISIALPTLFNSVIQQIFSKCFFCIQIFLFEIILSWCIKDSVNNQWLIIPKGSCLKSCACIFTIKNIFIIH